MWCCVVLCGFILFYFALGRYYCVLLCLYVVFETRTQSSSTSKTQDGSKTHGPFDRQTYTRNNERIEMLPAVTLANILVPNTWRRSL